MSLLLDIAPGEVIGSGVLPDSMNEETLVWAIFNNVIIEASGVGRPLGAQVIDEFPQIITHMIQQTSKDEGNLAFIAGQTSIWKWTGAATSLVNTPFTAGGSPFLETWGDFTLATNNVDKPKIRKGAGTTFVDLPGVNFDTARATDSQAASHVSTAHIRWADLGPVVLGR